jgi:hypothetical protein
MNRKFGFLSVVCLLSSSAPGASLEPISSAEFCGDCHRAIHETWKASSHAHAMDSRLFQDALHFAEADLGATVRGTCLGCHARWRQNLVPLTCKRR